MDGVTLVNNIPLEGILNIYKKSPSGDTRLIFSEPNLITTNAKIAVLQGLYALNLNPDPIIYLKVGTGGTIDPAGYYPKTEDPTQTDLISPALTVSASSTTTAGQAYVTFLADITTLQGNGLTITEAGLFKQSGSIFNVKNHPGIYKTAEFSLHYEWKIQIS